MTLVERLVEINDWPVCRKLILVDVLFLPLHVIAVAIAHANFVRSGVVDVGMLDAAYGLGTIGFLASLWVGLRAARAGREGRWGAYLLVVMFGTYLVCAMQLLGTWTSSSIMLLPVAVMTAFVVFGNAIGGFAFVYSLALVLLADALEALGMLPYAPAVLDRSIDVQRIAQGMTGEGALGLLAYFVAYASCWFTVQTRRQRETQLREARQQLERSNQLIARYIPAQVAERVIHGAESGLAQHERRRLTIFFSDLVGFTTISETLEPEDLSKVLNEYFSEMTTIARRHGGTVDELSGDAILIFFGAPQRTDDRDHAVRAVRMALEMQQTMADLNSRWLAAGITETLQLRVGINTGVVTVGNFGSPERMKYAVLGKHVNIAARLQSECEPGKVLLSHATWLLVRDHVACIAKGEVNLKGISKPVVVYQPEA